jgi:hypothetical protein
LPPLLLVDCCLFFKDTGGNSDGGGKKQQQSTKSWGSNSDRNGNNGVGSGLAAAKVRRRWAAQSIYSKLELFVV